MKYDSILAARPDLASTRVFDFSERLRFDLIFVCPQCLTCLIYLLALWHLSTVSVMPSTAEQPQPAQVQAQVIYQQPVLQHQQQQPPHAQSQLHQIVVQPQQQHQPQEMQ